ncbi:Serine/threonine-protein phosphatase 2A 55 kDa regulatory subunit B delta isoform [Thelohanellus kitauei]|uniref:Serine/threonine-protein phosphatase 2A 55 kDa regulatory subunit B delta isoform n=1 Tax=Thelohanellus kitauei TaxID=669202 RepID=A0A0C2M550_THEKT|nr:Serine/threonine-protein phosphatase 2A 55 kDa regulatory subunit B delta isoform [Thelohanellus kitauei]
MFSTFQSHQPDFDYLKSVEIEEKINDISWLEPYHYSHFLLTTNDKTVKFFRISETTKAQILPHGPRPSSGGGRDGSQRFLSRESSLSSSPVHDGKCKKVFSNAHHYNIHSVSVCSDQEYFISSDDLRINLWSLERNDTCFTIVDIKPENMEDLAEVITTAQFHTFEPCIFVYTTSKGLTKLCDTRMNAICDVPALVFNENHYINDSQFAEATLSISSFDFGSDPNLFLTRDYLNVNVWDLRMNKASLETHGVQEYLNHDDMLNMVYENDCLFDRFDARFTKNDKCIVTGTYNNMFAHRTRGEEEVDTTLYFRADLEHIQNRNNTKTLEPYHVTGPVTMPRKKNGCVQSIDVQNMNFDQKISSLDCHPREDLLVVGVEGMLLFLKNDKT